MSTFSIAISFCIVNFCCLWAVVPGGSLRFSTGGQLSLTPGQRIGKARRALAPRGVRGHAPPENFEILWSQGRVFLHFEAADNDFQQPKKITFLDNLIMIK